MVDRPTILVPIEVLEKESIPEGVPALLANAHVILLGYHVVPDQTATGQAREQFEDRATDRLEDFQTMFEEAGATVDSQLVFTHKRKNTINRMVEEHACLAVLIPGATTTPEDVIVPVRGTVGLSRFVRVIAGLFADTDVNVTLLHIAEPEETDEDSNVLLDMFAERLVDEGMEADAIDRRIVSEGQPQEIIVDLSDEYDVVVLGETDPSIITFVFGMTDEQLADRFLGPVLIVQREPPEDDEGD